MNFTKQYYSLWQIPDWFAAIIGAGGAFGAWHIADALAILSSSEGRIMVWGSAAYAAFQVFYGLSPRNRIALDQLDARKVREKRLSAIMGVAALVGMLAIALASYMFPTPMQHAILGNYY